MSVPGRRLDVVQLAYGGTGGQSAVARTIAAGLASVGLRSSVLLHARPQQMLDDDELWPSVDEVVRIPRRARLDPWFGRSLRAELHARPARVLLTHLTYGGGAVAAATRSGAVDAAVLVEHHSLARRRGRDDLRSRRMIRAVDAVVVLSQAYAEGYRFTDLARAGGRRLAVIPNGIDTERFQPAGPGPRPEGRRCIGMAGAMVPGKDQRTLILATSIVRRHHPDVTLVLMGDGPLRSSLEAFAAEVLPAGAIEFTGHVPEQELADRLRALDVYAHCTEGETQSLAVLQAQASGLPVVGTAVAGVVDAIADEVDGLTVPPHDPEALAAAILRLLDGGDVARDLGAAARARVEREAGEDRMIARYLELFASVDPTGPWQQAISRVDPS